LDSGGLPCDVDPSLPMPVRGLREVAYRAGKTVFDNDFSNSEWMRFMPDGHVTLENVLFAPLIIQGRAVGILGLGNKPGGFTENDAAMASAFGELAAIALHRNRLIEALQKSRDGLEIKVQERTAELLEKSRILKRINRLYSVLSKVNEAIVRIREPEKLYEQVCRIAVEDGSFKMAWIGLTDPETSEVKPVVSYGDTGGYLDEIIIYADDVPEGRGPTGRAVFEDKCFICDDVEEDLIMRPWRDRALRHGFRSSAAFPLHAGSSVIGAFTIYAGTPQFFSDGEISLLSSLVEDISFAIDVMANERKRVEAEGRLSLFNKLINQSSDFVFIVDAGQGCIIEVNDATCDTLGYRREEMLALKVEDISEGMVDYTVWREHVSEIAEIGQMLMEDRLRRKDGTTFPVEVNVKYTEHEKKDYLVAIVRDITGRKEIEDRISVTNAVLKLFVQKITRSEYLDSVVEILRKWSRCFSVGIRSLDERGHIPYESFTGFSQEFIDSESNLSVGKDQCACIRVITGKPDPWDMAFMTRGGSFYFNNAFELSGGLSDAEKSRFCSMCVRYGFKSLAIVPVRYHEKVIGVIHLADDTEGMLPLTRVEFIETLAPIIGEAICSFNAAEELRRSQEEMRSLTAHLQEVREAERTAISREIHDELGQIMTALKIDLSWIKNKYSDHMLLEKTGAMMSLVDSTIQTIKRIITELRPNILEHLGLIPALEWQAEEFQRITGIPCDFICTTSEIVLEKNISIHIFRIFQEILTNIARHAGATNVDVYLELGDDHLILNVADNGKGITEGKISNSSSFGIMGMRERAYSIGGDLKIVGIPQKGTTITLTVPVQNCVSS
jgi:PAS domain S-box-containing protein